MRRCDHLSKLSNSSAIQFAKNRTLVHNFVLRGNTQPCVSVSLVFQSHEVEIGSAKVSLSPILGSSALRSGGIAQLGERLHGMQEVSGSIPLTSTSFSEGVSPGPLRLEA